MCGARRNSAAWSGRYVRIQKLDQNPKFFSRSRGVRGLGQPQEGPANLCAQQAVCRFLFRGFTTLATAGNDGDLGG
jgi:hypothetical protein